MHGKLVVDFNLDVIYPTHGRVKTMTSRRAKDLTCDTSKLRSAADRKYVEFEKLNVQTNGILPCMRKEIR